jgi:hypothetical protein
MSDRINLDTKPTKEEAFLAHIEERNGRPVLVPYNQIGWLSSLEKLQGQEVVVRIERPKQRRTNAQNSYLWAGVYPDVLRGLRELAASVNEECPFKDEDALHKAMKYMVLGMETVPIPGTDDVLEQPSTTTTLTTAQFTEYVEHIVRWAAERGVPVRAPGEEFVA